MPFIEEKNLVDLHKLIEKGEKDLDLAAEQLKNESGKLEKALFIRKVLTAVIILMALGLVYTFYTNDKSINSEQLASKIAPIETEETAESNNEVKHSLPKLGLSYSVQIGAFKKFNIASLEETDSEVIKKRTSNGTYIYTVGSFTTYKEASALKEDLKALGFKDAFIVAINNGEDIEIEAALEISQEVIE
ncbi:SPOR domain-containing protein [Seonamhaeicola marinus]|uniref:SPOR domain-containing protein n=1 Tax=Seonamhaeicola marinus TaxID=1912246 RepID=A0A5D0HKY5_9FLAO|nr:SPOR domain-containing protein [Seonamhaeicola marinus]TYA71981.1 SPOR domain-containing protein [Seonamhaeicola marinus]